MSKYWDNFYAQRDRDNSSNYIKIDVEKLRKGIVVVKKQTTTTNNITDSIKRIFNER